MLRFAAAFLGLLKACSVLREGFNDDMLVAVVSCSPTSGRMRYAPTVGGEILTPNGATLHCIPNEQMVNM